MGEGFDGGFNIEEVKSNGNNLDYTINRTMMRVEMSEDLKPGEKFTCGIVDLEESYLYCFRKSDEQKECFFHDAKKPDWFFFHYKLFPYFGGNKTAPHDMNIYIRETTHYNRNI